LPDAGRGYELDVVICHQILAKSEDGGAAVFVELEHLDGVAEIEVEDLVGLEDVHLGEGSGFQEIVDGGAGGALAAREIDGAGGGIGAAEVATFDGMGLEIEEGLDFVGGHCQRCYQCPGRKMNV